MSQICHLHSVSTSGAAVAIVKERKNTLQQPVTKFTLAILVGWVVLGFFLRQFLSCSLGCPARGLPKFLWERGGGGGDICLIISDTAGGNPATQPVNLLFFFKTKMRNQPRRPDGTFLKLGSVTDSASQRCSN